MLEDDAVLGWSSSFFFVAEECFFCAEELDGGGWHEGESVESAGECDESCADEGSGEAGEVGCGDHHVGVDLCLEALDFSVDGGEDEGEGLSFVCGVGELAPASESFGEEVCGLDEVVEGVDELDDAEVRAVELCGDAVGGDVVRGFVEKFERGVVDGMVEGGGLEKGVVGLVGADGFKSFFVDDEVGVVCGEGVFLGEDVAVGDGA